MTILRNYFIITNSTVMFCIHTGETEVMIRDIVLITFCAIYKSRYMLLNVTLYKLTDISNLTN